MADLHTYISSVSTSGATRGLSFLGDGSRFYLGRYSGGVFIVEEYGMSALWDVTTAIATGNTFNTGVYGFTDVFITPDGARTYVVEGTAQTIREYSGVFPALTLQHTKNFLTELGGAFLSGMWMSEDGRDIFITNIAGALYHFTLGTAYNISTAVYVGSISTGLTMFNPFYSGAWVSSTGKKIMFAEYVNMPGYIDIYSIFLGARFDLTSEVSREMNRTSIPIAGSAGSVVFACSGNIDEDVFFINGILPNSINAVSAYTATSVITFWTNFHGQTEITS